MPKKSSKPQLQTISHTQLSLFDFNNFTLFGKKQLQMKPGFNIITYSSYVDKNLFENIIKITLNPEDFSNKKINIKLFNIFKSIKLQPKKVISYQVTILTHDPENLPLDFIDKFIVSSSLQIEIEINESRDILFKILNNDNKFINLTPSLEYSLSKFLHENLWLDESFFPYLNIEKLIDIIRYSETQLFEFFSSHLDLGRLKKDYFNSVSKINLLLLETENIHSLRLQADEQKFYIEKDIKLLDEIDLIEEKIQALRLEKEWSNYFDMKNKFQSKSSNIDQLKMKISEYETGKNKAFSDLESLLTEISNLKDEITSITQDYDNQRKNFLSEKASLDRIDRNLRDWGSSVTKVEKDLKFKSMKLKDKEKKLQDISSRLIKEKSENLISQKEKLEAEIKKDSLEIKNLQENLDAVKNEKNLKSKEKNVKEKSSQPKAEKLAKLSSKITDLNQTLELKEEEKNSLEEKLKSLDNAIQKSQKEMNALQEEVLKLEKDINNEIEDIKAKGIEKPKNNRSLSTVNVLLRQLENEKNRLQNNITRGTDRNSLSDHEKLMKDLDKELDTRKSNLIKIQDQITDLQKQWNELFQNDLFQTIIEANKYLSNSKLTLQDPKFISLLPNEGAIAIEYSIMSETPNQSHDLRENIPPSYLVSTALIFSLINLSRPNLYILDFLDFLNNSKNQMAKYLSKFVSDLTKSIENNEKKAFQVILCVSENVLDSSLNLTSFDVTKI